ncbi:N-acetylmuramoyl-L-alanine amidase [Pelagibius sp.]|uniref:peptidoglycan recognition protein family protein n=1 Tax=Pelagibius sp. TaxID=1931238 RepID=UPI002604F693|nr:N-acetylmuramoyl-L-alanine amidase [Pelagibius sp.]
MFAPGSADGFKSVVGPRWDEAAAVQYDATVTLCRDLMRRFRIAADRVTLHGETPGEATLCPGKNFPRDSFFKDMRRA